MTKNDSDNDLSGFSEILDELEVKKPKLRKDTSQFGFELVTFLEQETLRLKKMNSLFKDKAYMIRKYPQDTALVIEQEHENIKERIELTELLKKKNSPLVSSLSEIFREYFQD